MNLSYLSLIISIILLVVLYLLKKKKVSFTIRVFAAMLLGIAIGIIFKKDSLLIEPVGIIFVSLIKMLVIPLVITALISSVTSLDNTEKLKKIGFKTIGFLILTTAIATVVGTIVARFMDLGSGMEFTKNVAFKAKDVPSFVNVILDMVPTNPVNEMANGKIIPVIVFSIFISIAIIIEGSEKPEAVKPFKDFINSFATIMFRITKIVIELTPYAVFSLMIPVAAKYGLSSLIPLAKVIIAMYVACFIHIIIVHGGLIKFVVKISPIKFFKKISPALIVAFTTRSSYGTLPVTIRTLTDKVKISEKIASFSAPLGASIGMNGGGGIYPAIVAIFVARIFNIHLSIMQYILLVVTTTIGSIGIAGVPGAATISATVVLASLGLPVEGLAMLLGIDVIMDMVRTMTNVAGASVVSLLVASSEDELDRNEFNDISEGKSPTSISGSYML